MSGSGQGFAVELLKWVTQALVVGVGWLVVHRLSAQRDRDKARREMVAKSADSLVDAVTSLLVEAREYHLSERDVGKELRIKMALQDTAMRASSLSEISQDESVLAPCRADIAALRRAITGAHFEDEYEGALAESESQFQEIADAVSRTKRSLLRLKHRQFPPE